MRVTFKYGFASFDISRMSALRLCCYFIGFAFILFVFLRHNYAQEHPHSIPSKQEQKDIRKLIAEVYDDPDGEQLLNEAVSTEDVKQKYVLLNEAGKIFVQNLDVASALRTADIISRTYVKDKLSIQIKVLNATYKNCKSKDHKPLLEISNSAMQIAVALVHADDFEGAIKMYEIAGNAAKKAKNAKLRRDVQKKLIAVKTLRQKRRTVTKNIQTLENDPTNPASNFLVGQYYCFDKGNWEKGLPYLALGSDEDIAKIAKRELKNPTDPVAIRDLADAWWQEASKKQRPLQAQMQARAKYWYIRILPLIEGLEKKQIAKRINVNPHYMFRHADIRSTSAEGNLITEATRASIDAALRWLAKHQNEDGSWSFNFTLGGKCSGFSNPGDIPAQGPSPKMGATGMALLCFLADGYTHLPAKNNKYEYVVRKGLAYLVGNMDPRSGRLYEPNGYWHYHMYSHGIAACAIAEAYGMTQDQKLKPPAQKAIDYIIAAQDPKSGGWLYEPKQGGDTSVFGWQVRALKSAVASNLKVPAGVIPNANQWLDQVGLNPVTSPNGDRFSQYGYREATIRAHVVDGDAAMTAIGILSRSYLGAQKEDLGQRKGVEWIVSSGPGRDNIYYNYYATMAVHQNDGAKGALWKKWNSVMRDMLINSQVKQGSDTGSWYYGGNHGETGGRLMCTCLATLILQNDYRYTDFE